MAPVKKELAELGRTYIAEWREHRRLTQEQLAEGINMSRSSLSKIETSDAPYTQRTLEAIASVLQCQPWELIAVNPSHARKDADTEKATRALRSAMLAYGVDHTQLTLAISIIDRFVANQANEAQSEQIPSDGQSQPAKGRRVSTP